MPIEALVFLKSESGKAREVLTYVARSKTGKVGRDQKYAEAGVENVFRTKGEFDVVVQVSRANRAGLFQLVKSIRKHVPVRKHKIIVLHPKMPGDP